MVHSCIKVKPEEGIMYFNALQCTENVSTKHRNLLGIYEGDISTFIEIYLFKTSHHLLVLDQVSELWLLRYY